MKTSRAVTSRAGSVYAGFFLLLLLFFISSCDQRQEVKQPVDYVDPFIGTDFFAHMFPGPTLPFGMVQLSPDTYNKGWTYASGYQYADNSLMGFSHTHYSGVGMVAEGDILLMPTVSQRLQVAAGSRENPDEGYRSRFDHNDEMASPGYYSVILKDYGVKAELTTTRRAGMHKYTFPKTNDAHILLDLGHSIGKRPEGKSHLEFSDNHTIQGYKISFEAIVYFVAEFSRPFGAYGTWDANYRTPESGASVFPWKSAESGENIGAFVNYRTHEGEVIYVKVGLSYVSIEGARKNLESEIPEWDFERVRKEARKVWNKELSKLQVKSDNNDQKQVFYTALYHSLLAQGISNDVDGKYMGMDGKIHTAEGFDFYPSFFCWDTYRSEQPLMTLIEPGHINDMIKSIISKTRHYGWLPAQHHRNVFGQGMAGDHLVPVIVDAWMKGFRDYDAEFLYEAMFKKATQLPPPPLPPSDGRSGLHDYETSGYVPVDKRPESVSNTLELAYDDWCIAQMAKGLGKTDDYNRMIKRAGNYRHLFDPHTDFMRPKLSDGTWLPSCGGRPVRIKKEGNHTYYDCFDPLLVGRRPNRYFTESNAWQYIWSVQHDVKGLIDLFGSTERFTAKLDSLFTIDPEISGPKYVGVVGTIGQYVQGNQPSHHVAYLYNYAGQPWKTQEKVRRVMDLYRTGPGGICGNEDMGSLSSWYVFSAMGFYPVTPGSNIYMIGSPLFEEVKLTLSTPYDEGEFTVRANHVSGQNKYIQSAILNGEPLTRPWISHEEIIKGGHLIFEMGPEPNYAWGSSPEDIPPGEAVKK
ncbi:MAG: glycoside hydrolase family 92 protein [Chlorobi bacterium]|nr:glycoside hydrolase family 92 protein [Chlorobiota bacterium]